MKRRATACFVPRWIKKSSSLSVSLRRIISPKSEQINHLEKNEGRLCVCVCVEHPYLGALQGLCACRLCVCPPVCVFLCVGVLQHPCLCMCLFVWLSSWESTEGMKKRMVISVWGEGGRGALARGSMIKTLNQTPCSNITAESCNFNFFRPVDTNKLDMTPSNINQPLQETPGCCNGGLVYARSTVSMQILQGLAVLARLLQHKSSFQEWRRLWLINDF